MTKEEYEALNKEPEDYIESNEEFAVRIAEWKKTDVTEPAYYEYAIKHHALKKAKFDELRARKIEALKEHARLNPDDAYYNVDKLDSMNPIYIDRLYSFHFYDDESTEFWDVVEMPPWRYGETRSDTEFPPVHLIASDNWGGGRRNMEWHIDTDTSGCFDIDIPGHFCGGIEDLEKMILALVNARNIMAKHYPSEWCQWDGKGKEWEIHDEPKVLTEPKERDIKESS